MRTHWLMIAILTCLTFQVKAQMAMLEDNVTFNYQKVALGEALTDISEKYKINFSYSRDFIPVDQSISVVAFNTPLRTALDKLFETTTVVYAVIGNQVMLRVDPAKKPVLRPLREETYGESTEKEKDRSYAEDAGGLSGLDTDSAELILEPIPSEENKTLEEESAMMVEPNLDLVEVDDELSERSLRKRRERVAQVSLFPNVGTNMGNSDKLTNNFSINVFWGRNGGVDGLEVGGFVNSIKNDMIGVQVAGLGNSVDGMMHGTQVAGLFNYTGAYATGLQAAGIFNHVRSGNVSQVAGLFNSSSGDIQGLQVAGLGNMVNGDMESIQVAGLYNTSTGRSRLQVSGLFNIAGDVKEGQVSALLNVGKKVGGFQIGLINICDTISGVPLGLINIVKKGYNRWDLSGGEALHINSAFTFGAYSFYNILRFGMRIENRNPPIADRDGKITWGIGYGFGTSIKASPKSRVNMELVAMHINERETFTRKLNLLTQFRIVNNFRLGQGRSSMFIGPTFNLMASQLFDPDTQTYGSAIAPYNVYNRTTDQTNIQAWVGGTIGFRF